MNFDNLTEEQLAHLPLSDKMEYYRRQENDVAGQLRYFAEEINSKCEKARGYITGATYGPYQSMVYQEKVEQATDYIASNYSDDVNKYPFIDAEADVTGKTHREVADYIITLRTRWVTISVAIERLKMKAKMDILTAVSVDALYDILDNLDTKLQTLANTFDN